MGESILQYADNTKKIMEHNLEKALNMKLILCIFEQLSRLKINFHKVRYFASPMLRICKMSQRFYLVLN
jgi:hypothetical protein